MKTHKFNTNIKCGNCEAKVKTVLEQKDGFQSFHVDLTKEKRPLAVTTDDGIDANTVINWIKEAGFEAIAPKGGIFKKLFS